MLRRPPTTLTITRADLTNHDRTRSQRTVRAQEFEESQTFAANPSPSLSRPYHLDLDPNDDPPEEVPTEVDEDEDEDENEDGGLAAARRHARMTQEDGGDVRMMDADSDAEVSERRNARALDPRSVTARTGARGMRGDRAGRGRGAQSAQDVADGVAASDANANANVGMSEAERRRARIMGMASSGATAPGRGAAAGRGGAPGYGTGTGGGGRRGR